MQHDFEFVDIVSSKEDWSLYKLEDDTILKIRFILIKAVREAEFDRFGNPTYSLNSQNVIGVIPSKSAIGSPSKPYTQEELASSVIHEDMKFKIVEEPWNEYKFKDETVVKVKLVLSMVSKTSKFDAHGEPIYLVNAQPIVKGIVPPKLMRKKEPPHPTFEPA